MWEETKIEKYLENRLCSCYNKQEAEFFFSLYTDAKSYLCDHIYSQIPSKEPGLTDHTEKHIVNVLKNAWKLITDKEEINSEFNEIEILLLCVSILFHDVGNIHGRTDHNSKIVEIYNAARASKLDKCKQERLLVQKVVKAHCGKSKRGDKDTLLEVQESAHLFDKPIRLRELAAILRFADELAEGPQRTSQYMIDKKMIKDDSLIYHIYASITEVTIDKGDKRIILTYNIDYPTKDILLSDLLRFVYMRILKMDMERRYCKYYAPTLSVFLRTEASINFTINGSLCDFDLPKISLEDKYSLVEENIEDLLISKPQLNIESIESELHKIVNEGGEYL